MFFFFFCRYIWGSCPPNTKKLATLVLALPMITTMSNKDSATMTGTFIIFILNLFLVVFFQEKRDLSQHSGLRLVYHELAVSHRAGPSQPGPGPCAAVSGVDGLTCVSVEAANHQCWLVVSNIVHALFVYFLLIVAICTIYRSTNFIYYWEICIFAPIIASMC